MGASFPKLFEKKPVRILLIGFDAAGKTTMLWKLKLGEIETHIPTIGMSMETLQYKNVAFTSMDIGGRGMIRPLMRHYYAQTDALVFVVDSNDRERMDEVKDELHRLLREEALAGCPLLLLANKQDLPNAMTEGHLAEALDLHSLRNRDWYIKGTCATKGDGLYEGLDWLSSTLKVKHAKNIAASFPSNASQAVTRRLSESWTHTVNTVGKLKNWAWSSTKLTGA